MALATRPPSPKPTLMRPADLLVPRPEGLYCPPGDFHIDPVRPVPRALVTHAHSDHATPGHGAVLATHETLDIMAIRLGDAFAATTQAIPYGQPLTLGAATVTFHPAGHVLGSAQIEVATPALRIVAAGDYKRTPDATCAGFEPVPCDIFITEATFALPVERGDYGSGAVEIMGGSDVLVCLLEHEPEAASTKLFQHHGVPRLNVAMFSPQTMQRTIAGMSGTQHFFRVAGRPFCLYVVVGSHRTRGPLVRAADAVISTIDITS